MNKNNLRKGMWVKTMDGEVGILAAFLDYSDCEVHLTNELGETRLVVLKPKSELIQASYMDIPENRRPENLEYARSKGY